MLPAKSTVSDPQRMGCAIYYAVNADVSKTVLCSLLCSQCTRPIQESRLTLAQPCLSPERTPEVCPVIMHGDIAPVMPDWLLPHAASARPGQDPMTPAIWLWLSAGPGPSCPDKLVEAVAWNA